jgi:nicotinamidase/pyrazinamidase
MDALIIVDVQNDFCPGGALPVPNGDEVIEPINGLAQDAPFVVATRDWHPPDHASFAENGGPWPVHCVQGTPGAEIDSRIDRRLIDVVVDVGQARDAEGYSGFEDTRLEEILREQGVRELDVTGLALDYCVKATALDARRAGFEVVVHEGATRAIDASPGDGDRALEELRAAGVKVEP